MKSTKKSPPLERAVCRALDAAEVKRGARLVVGVSGGPDSTALLSALCALHPRTPYTLTACLVDHGIRSREEIEGDIAFVRGLAGSLGAEFRLLAVPDGVCAARARQSGLSLEECARDLRLAFLRDAARDAVAEAVVLGHTADDQAETLIMRVITGSGPEGLSGIALRRGLYVRPLLSVSRAEVLQYLSTRGLGFRTDSTNADTRFLRNRIRSIVIPALESAYPGFREGLASMAGKLGLSRDLVSSMARERLQWKEADGAYLIDEAQFLAAPAAVRAHSLMELYDRTRRSGSARRLPYPFLLPALGARPPARVILDGHGIRLRRDNGFLVWESMPPGGAVVMEGEKSYFIAVETDGSYIVSGAALQVDVTKEAGESAGSSCPRITMSAINPPLVLRSRRGGDVLPMTYGRKSVKELLSEWKVPHGVRSLIPLLADRSGVVAVLGGVFGFPDLVRADVRGGAAGNEISVRVSRLSS